LFGNVPCGAKSLQYIIIIIIEHDNKYNRKFEPRDVMRYDTRELAMPWMQVSMAMEEGGTYETSIHPSMAMAGRLFGGTYSSRPHESLLYYASYHVAAMQQTN
jgi:hypothetical protein